MPWRKTFDTNNDIDYATKLLGAKGYGTTLWAD